jgi:hypothetical protein
LDLRDAQIDGMRRDAPRIRASDAGGNIEMGGPNAHQLVSHVRSFDPRGWTCLHVAEGALPVSVSEEGGEVPSPSASSCSNATVEHNDIGPCGANGTDEWADGISFSCAAGSVRMNRVFNPTDGGIVLFGSPGTLVENNTIMVHEVRVRRPLFLLCALLIWYCYSHQQTLLGGINMVDYDPWNGNYTDTVVRNNTIIGAFPYAPNRTAGGPLAESEDVIVKSVTPLPPPPFLPSH